jgi:DNA polymerase-3 subunit beta
MRVSIVASALKDALVVASKVASKTGAAATQRVLLSADTDLVVCGTDLRSRAWLAAPADVSEAGGVCLPPKAIDDLLAILGRNDVVDIASDAKHRATLTSGRTTVRLGGADPEEFPVAPSYADPLADASIDGASLASLVLSVAHAARDPEEAARPILAGVLLASRGGRLEAAAADGFRLAIRSIEVAGLPDFSIVAQGDRLAEAAARAARAGAVRLVVDGRLNGLLIESAVGCWSVALVDGQFPDYRRVVPTTEDVKTIVEADRAELLRALKLVTGVTREGSAVDGTKLGKVTIADLAVADGGLTIKASDQYADREASASIDVEIAGPSQALTVNGGYIRDAVEALEGKRVVLDIVGPKSPTVIREAGERNDHLQIAMPWAGRK